VGGKTEAKTKVPYRYDSNKHLAHDLPLPWKGNLVRKNAENDERALYALDQW